MAELMTVITSPVKAAGDRRGTKTKLFRRTRRAMLRKLSALMNHLINADAREAARGAEKDYTPALIFGREGSVIRNSFERIRSRVSQCLAMNVGDE